MSSSISTTATNQKKHSPFFTTSDLLNTINSSLQSDGNDTNGCFTLQRRLPDGQTTRQAAKDEITAAYFQSKLQQASAFYAKLFNNKMQAEYTVAMDIYLTRLVGLNTKDTDDTIINKEELAMAL